MDYEAVDDGTKSKHAEEKDHITVCICTYKRPLLLKRLLQCLSEMVIIPQFFFSIVVVDNDAGKTGKPVVDAFRKKSDGIRVDYYYEIEQNISLARNMAVKNADGNLIAFIDDDEFPEKNWLKALYREYKGSKVDGVLGPVVPHFEVTPPDWIIKGKICIRKSFPTGTRLTKVSDTRTGNALISKDLFASEEPFAREFGRTGGEDLAFFRGHLNAGKEFIWCNEAIVYETVPVERQKRMYYLKRAFIRGVIASQNIPVFSIATLKSLIAVPVYTSILPFLFLFSPGLFMRYLINNCDHISKMLAYIKLNPAKVRPT